MTNEDDEEFDVETAILDRQLRRYLALPEDKKRLADAIAKGERHLYLAEQVAPLLNSADPLKRRKGAEWMVEMLKRESDK